MVFNLREFEFSPNDDFILKAAIQQKKRACSKQQLDSANEIQLNYIHRQTLTQIGTIMLNKQTKEKKNTHTNTLFIDVTYKIY